jgi:hypothetical protein
MKTYSILQSDRPQIIRRGRALQYATMAWNGAEFLIAVLAGLNAWLGWWWADPVAALAMVPLIGWEGIEAVRGRTCCA